MAWFWMLRLGRIVFGSGKDLAVNFVVGAQWALQEKGGFIQ